MDTDINILNINFDSHNVCRTCLQTSDEMESIFKGDTEMADISRMIRECSSTEVQESDGLPEQICIDCISDVKTSFKFKQKCERSYRILKDLAQNLKLEKSLDSIENTTTKKNEYTQTEERTFHFCEMCELKFISEDALRSHRYNHKGENYKCRKCKQSYARLFPLQRHIARSHPEISNFKALYETNQCKFCEKQFSRTENLRKHIATQHESEESSYEENSGSDVKESDEESILKNNETDIKMEIKLSVNPESSKKIISNKRKSKLGSTTKMDKLKKKFETKNRYSIHTDERHQNAKVHICEKCGKTFSRAAHLRRHEVLHLEIKPFQCEVCEKKFSRVDNLNLHKLQHLEHKPFMCEICSKGFTRSEHLKKHQDKIH